MTTPPDQANGSIQKERIHTYVRVLQKDPESRVFAALAILLAQEDKINAALGICKRGVNARPDFSDGHWAYAQILYMSENLTDALKEIDTTLSLDNQKVQAHLLAARIHDKIGNSDQARKSFQRVLEIDPHNPSALKHLGYTDRSSANPKQRHQSTPDHNTKILSPGSKRLKHDEPRSPKPPHSIETHLDLSFSNLDRIQAIIDEYSIHASTQEPGFSHKDLKIPRNPYFLWLLLLLCVLVAAFGIVRFSKLFTS